MFGRLTRLFGRPLFWSVVINVLAVAFVLNLVSHGKFDPGMAYSSFLENWLQVLALGVTTVAGVETAAALASLHSKHDDLHEKIDGMRDTEG